MSQLTIPGFTYPVREFYLEDVLQMTNHSIARTSRYARKLNKTQLAQAMAEWGQAGTPAERQSSWAEADLADEEETGDGEDAAGGIAESAAGATEARSLATLSRYVDAEMSYS